MGAITDKSIILNYLSGDIGRDHRNRTYLETLAWDDYELELCHDQVQWIFPLHEDSRMTQTYPVLTPDVVKEAKKDPRILKNLRLAKDRFEQFFAIGDYEDVDKQRKWLRPRNHNLLRVTRIIRCLRLFGLDDESKDFYKNVLAAANRFDIDENTYKYWQMAYHDDVWETMQI